MTSRLPPAALACVLAVLAALAPLTAQEPYRLPPDPIARCVLAPPLPSVGVSPDRSHLLLVERESLPSIAVLARPVLKLAGVRFDPKSRGPQRDARTVGFELLRIADGARRRVPVPADADLGAAVWAADGARFAFTNTTEDRIELWVCDVATAQAKRIDGVQLGDVIGTPVQWMPDQRTLLCQVTVVAGTPPGERPAVPAGPTVQETSGAKAPVRTYQDLLADEHDAALFEHYAATQLALVDADRGTVRPASRPGLLASASASPDGRYLLVRRPHRPFSYLVPYGAFPTLVAVTDLDGNEVARVADLPLADRVPIGGVPTGPRDVQWVPSEDHTLLWVEALDGGDPRARADHRDRVMVLEVGAAATPSEWTRTEHRFAGMQFAADGALVLLAEFDRDARRSRTWRIGHRATDVAPVLLFDRSTQDAYGDPGRPLTRPNARGDAVLHLVAQGALLLSGPGASPDGERPFLDRFDLETKAAQRLFHCGDGAFEQVVSVLDDDAAQLLVRHEIATAPPSWVVVDTLSGARRPVLELTDPLVELTKGIRKRLLKYQREDGLGLSGTLYTPPNWDGQARLPLLVWAYPQEFTRGDDAGQVRGSPARYTRPTGTSPLLLTLAGYAVLEDAAMPIVGPTRTANDTFVPQLVANAKAAIEAVVELGAGDRDRVAISGHSYGAFMTANLLAHSDLFRAGVARSGAYNRTLTPFGFQNEDRTLWEAPDVYAAMSPFMNAPSIDEPLLLIHGEADNNPGTFTLQSQRLFHAIKGNGGTARLVLLPFESHGYRARESVLHVLAETLDWLERYVKNAPPRGGAIESSAVHEGNR